MVGVKFNPGIMGQFQANSLICVAVWDQKNLLRALITLHLIPKIPDEGLQWIPVKTDFSHVGEDSKCTI